MRNIVISLIALVLVVALAASCGLDSGSEVAASPYFESFSDAKIEAAAKGRPILLDFYTDW